MDKEELRAALLSEFDGEVKQKEYPFMIIFYNLAKTVSEFSVKIIETK